MIRVLVKASSARAQASLEGLLRAHRNFELADESPAPDADIWLIETESLSDALAREAMDWAKLGGPSAALRRTDRPI